MQQNQRTPIPRTCGGPGGTSARRASRFSCNRVECSVGCLRGERSWRMNGVRPPVCASVVSPVHIHRLSATSVRTTSSYRIYRTTTPYRHYHTIPSYWPYRTTLPYRPYPTTSPYCPYRITAAYCPTALQRLAVHYYFEYVSTLLCESSFRCLLLQHTTLLHSTTSMKIRVHKSADTKSVS